MATPTIRFQGRADADLPRFLRCFAGETGVTSMQIVMSLNSDSFDSKSTAVQNSATSRYSDEWFQ